MVLVRGVKIQGQPFRRAVQARLAHGLRPASPDEDQGRQSATPPLSRYDQSTGGTGVSRIGGWRGVINQLISTSLLALRPQCDFSRELTATLDAIVALSNTGEARLQPPLKEAGAVLPEVSNPADNSLVADLFSRMPLTIPPAMLPAEVFANLRLLAQHLELKARLAAEEALLLGQNRLGDALVDWSADWRAFGYRLRAATVRARAQAYVADLAEFTAPQGG